jgi:hypothetical protein
MVFPVVVSDFGFDEFSEGVLHGHIEDTLNNSVVGTCVYY